MNNLDFKGMIEANYNVLSNLEANIQAFFKSFQDIDTKIVEKETAFINAKQELKEFMQEYKKILEATREEFKIELVKEQKQFIEIANANTKEVLNARKEELTEIMEQEKQKVLLKTEKVITILESFQDNINSKIADILKDLPSASEDYINNVILDVKKIGSTLKNDVEEYKKLSLEEVNSCKDTLKQSTKAIKEVAEDIKAENSNIIKNRNNLEADYKKVNSSLEKVSKDINNLIKGINNVKYTFLINKIYILLFSLLNSLFILRIIVPQQWKFNFYGKKTLWTLIIVASLLIVVGIGDFIYRTILPILSNLFTSEEEADED